MSSLSPEVIKDSKLNIMLDISQFDTFRACEQKYFLRYMRNKQTLDRAKPLDRGTLVHLAEEIYFTGIMQGQPYEDNVVKALSAVRRLGVIETGLDIDEILAVVDTMEENFDFWKTADYQQQIIEVEKPFIYLFYEADDWRLYLTGKIDLITSDNKHINLPWDHKSFDRTAPTGRLSNQFRNYAQALNSQYLVVNKIGFQKTLPRDKKFLRPMLTYEKGMFDKWKINMIASIEHYISCAAEAYWPLNETSCNKFNKQCEYLDVCDAPDVQTAEYKLLTMFIDGEPWDVTKSLKKTSDAILQLHSPGPMKDEKPT